MIIITCTYNKLTRDYGTCRIDGAKSYKQARYATGGKPNYPVPALIPSTEVKSPMLWALVLNGSCYIINNCN